MMELTDKEVELLKESLRMLCRGMGYHVDIQEMKELLKKLNFTSDEIEKIAVSLIVANGIREAGRERCL